MLRLTRSEFLAVVVAPMAFAAILFTVGVEVGLRMVGVR